MEVGREMNIDESFKKPGSIPFKWEIQPGIPKPQPSPTTTPLPLPPKLRSCPSMLQSQSSNLLSPSAFTPQAFPSQGCFAIPLVKRRDDKKGVEPIAWLQRRSMSPRFTPLFSSPSGKSMQGNRSMSARFTPLFSSPFGKSMQANHSMSARFAPLFSSPFGKSMQAKDDIKLDTYTGSSGVACNNGSI
ncbi:uncharacterized protein LOC103702734 [Phoenix dactylifera]|uniref:Uncharacterized protein LOC103702734 n=1 Tax=Phoenix dactylifera TaxID=42345 RepID=A0A8B7BR41_PHODC|nr:uncharacterized protein LOC103702734 [Phoenix dactylifera]